MNIKKNKLLNNKKNKKIKKNKKLIKEIMKFKDDFMKEALNNKKGISWQELTDKLTSPETNAKFDKQYEGIRKAELETLREAHKFYVY